jgi:hypothetical protein
MPITDEDVLRELLHRATDDLHAPSAVTAGIVTRHHRRLRNTRILSVTTTGVAAAAVVAAVVAARVGPSAPSQARHPAALPATELLPTKLPPVELTAMQVLDQLSVAAARAQQPTGRYVALTEIRQGLVERTTVFDGLTGDVWTYQHGGGVPGELPVATHWSPTRAEFAAWPTNPAKLRALLLSPRGQTLMEGEEGSEEVNGETPDGLVFQEATNWLWNPLLSSALRSAMYKVLAATPGVTVKTGTTDATGRPAIEISRYDNNTHEQSTTFESPSTGAVLEQDFSDAGTAVYVAVTGYSTPPTNPYSG